MRSFVFDLIDILTNGAISKANDTLPIVKGTFGHVTVVFTAQVDVVVKK